MSPRFDWNLRVVLAVGMVGVGGVAVAQNKVPDAQVEANVLKALAGAPELANQSITTKTVYGTVTLSGSVTDESARTKAENLAANAQGVVKVVDELQVGSGAVAGSGQQQGSPAHGPGTVLLSDGTWGPDPALVDPSKAQRNNPDADQALDQQMQQNQPAGQSPAQPAPSGNANNQSPAPQQPYPQRRPMYPPQSPYGYPPQQGAHAQQQRPIVGGQEAGQAVTIPAGAMLRVRINRTLSSKITPTGTTFDGIVVNDVVANGLVAIPRGASVQGSVIAATSSGALKGRGEISIQLTSVTLGGKQYPIVSDVWAHNGTDKTIETVNKTLGLGALGAIVGAVAGGGRGAAIGGGVGAAAGVGSSASTGDRQVYLPAEAIVVFHTAQPAEVATVSEQEMQRLAYGIPAAGQAPMPRGYRAYPGYYPPPGYPYPAYGYPQ